MATTQPDATPKPIHSLILDTGPLIKNDPPANTLRAKAEQLYTLPCIISEIRDAATRSRVETTLLPFITLRSPRPESIKFVQAFARRTGDLAVLSKPDIDVLALGYELECERNGGDWRLRNTPGQKGLNGKPPQREQDESATKTEDGATPATADEQPPVETEATEKPAEESPAEEKPAEDKPTDEKSTEEKATEEKSTEEKSTEEKPTEEKPTEEQPTEETPATKEEKPLEESVQNLSIESEVAETTENAQSAPKATETEAAEEPFVKIEAEEVEEEEEDDGEASDDDGGWITPSNLKKHQHKDTASATPSQPTQRVLQAAVLTSDYAMQNVALRMNLNLVAPSLARITQLKSWVLRCHGCFAICKDMEKQFCPSCGQPTLMRTSCSTDDRGNFRVHLKKNFQWNNRGNVYSVPRPVHGSANGRLPRNAAGKGNWGNDLVLAADQKEYTRALDEQRRSRKKDIMDQDYLPDLLSGHRASASGKIRVGAGRRVNSKKKH